MEKTKRVTIIDRAKKRLMDFQPCMQKVTLEGLSESTLSNYNQCIAKIILHSGQPAVNLEENRLTAICLILSRDSLPQKAISSIRSTV